MLKRYVNNWRSSLQLVSWGLLILAAFAPLPETLSKVLTAVALAGTLVVLATDSPAMRKEFAGVTILLVVLVLLALLLSVNLKWAIFGGLGIYVGGLLWGVGRREHAEYLTERERPG